MKKLYRPLLYGAASFCSSFGAALAMELNTAQQWTAAIVGALGSAFNAIKAALPTPSGEARNQPQPHD